MDPDAEQLVRRYLPARVAWPSPVGAAPDRTVITDLFRGSLLWGAVGDAIGRANERDSWDEIRARWGPDGLTGYEPRNQGSSGPKGTWTDDTQLTSEVARAIIDDAGALDPAALADRFVAWLPHGRGIGRATSTAVRRLQEGEPWWIAGPAVDSAGNGAAMRVAPIGLRWSLAPDPDGLVRDAVVSALPTHGHPVGVAAAVVMAAGLAYCIREALSRRPVDPQGFLDFVATVIAGMEPGPTPLRSDTRVSRTLHDQVLRVGELLDADPKDVFVHDLWSGAFALESVPAALYCFLRSPDRPTEVILTAANAGHDTDTIASMAGNLVGAIVGAERLRGSHRDWWDELEERDMISDLADGLADLAFRSRSMSGSA